MAQPESYRFNTKKEQLMLKYVGYFAKQFQELHPKRKPLMLTPRNECGMHKFICTTLKPTQLPYQDLYDYDKCAKFVADFIKYEPLELAGSLPQHMPSPTAVLGWQAGDCFDMAQVLCSLLLGVGYDAYVVSGYAPGQTTRCDLSAKAYKLEPNVQKAPAEETAPPGKYAVRPRKVLESQFEKQKAEREAAARDKASQSGPPEISSDDRGILAAQEAEELDDMKGRRVHAWVMILAGKRMLEQMLFIEPSCGDVFPIDAAPYYGIESLWNSSNYWVNMQPGKPIKKLTFDLTDHARWEYMLLDNILMTNPDAEEHDTPLLAAQATEAMGAAAEDEGAGAVEAAEVEMPPSWVPQLQISRADFESRCPSGRKETVYRKGLVRQFAPYSRDDGMVEQVTVFEDAARTVTSEIRESFENRKDRLYRRVTWPKLHKTHEFFSPGRQHGLKEYICVDGVLREYYFYNASRLDGLISRVEEIGNKTYQIFDGSKDALIYRSVSYHTDEDAAAGEPIVRKMAEKFRRTPEIEAEEDVAKRTFDMAGGMIKVRYHYGRDRVTCSFRTYPKDGSQPLVTQVDPFARLPTDQQLLEEFTKLQATERECINEIRDADRLSKDILKKRKDEEVAIVESEQEAARLAPGVKPLAPPTLSVSVYDTARSKLAAAEETDEDASAQVPHDYLTPFLAVPIAITDPPLSRDDALAARDACLASLKERLVERANIVQSRLDEENANLSKRQAAFQRNRDHMDPSDEAEYERYCDEANFRIQILEQRLDRHTVLSLEKYTEMDVRLREDPRLRAMAA